MRSKPVSNRPPTSQLSAAGKLVPSIFIRFKTRQREPDSLCRTAFSLHQKQFTGSLTSHRDLMLASTLTWDASYLFGRGFRAEAFLWRKKWAANHPTRAIEYTGSIGLRSRRHRHGRAEILVRVCRWIPAGSYIGSLRPGHSFLLK